jgi:hypothetical protein
MWMVLVLNVCLYDGSFYGLWENTNSMQCYKQEVLGRTDRLLSFHYIYYNDRIENTTSSSSVVAYVFVARGNVVTEPLPSNVFGWTHSHTYSKVSS